MVIDYNKGNYKYNFIDYKKGKQVLTNYEQIFDQK